MEVYANGFGLVWLHFVVDDPLGGVVVSLEWVSWMFVSHFIQYYYDVYGLS